MKKGKNKQPSIVIYDNNYMEALYQTDYLAKKIMIAASLRCGNMDWKPEGCEIIISSNELRELSGVTRNSLKHLEHAIKKLVKTDITIRDPKDSNHWLVFNYLPRGEYEKGTLSLLINREMKPFIQDLQKNFTQYHIENIKPLKSGYSIRIFELLKMSAYKGKYRVEIDALKKMFGIAEKYKDYSHLKARVLEPAKKELKEHCEIYFEYKEIKTGNKVTGIEFEIFKQKKDFSGYEEVIEAKVKDFEFKKGVQIKSELEIELNKLGWTGDFQELLKEVSKEAIKYYMDTLKVSTSRIEQSKMVPEQLYRFIDTSIKKQAEKSYALYKEAFIFELPSEKKQNKDLSDIGKQLIKLGFIGDVEKYIKEEGKGVIEEALKNVKGQPSVRNACGLLRERVKALKGQKILFEQEKIETAQKTEKELRDRIDKYLSKSQNFSEDYNRFIEINLLEEDITVLKKHIGKTIEDLPKNILNEFLKWIS